MSQIKCLSFAGLMSVLEIFVHFHVCELSVALSRTNMESNTWMNVSETAADLTVVLGDPFFTGLRV